MKKLITASLIAILGTVANAATCNWVVGSGWVSTDGENPLVASVYAFDALAYSSTTIASALAGGDKSVLGNALAFGSVDSDEGTFSFSGAGITDDEASPASASAFVVLLANDDLGAEFFYTTDTKKVILSDAVLADKANFYWEEITPSEVGGSGWTAVAPEPTSGLLLLLGMAGLALRRKQK